MKRCEDREAKRALQALFQGALDAEGFARLRAHAAGCEECREAYDKLGRVESALEKRALPEGRQALLEEALFARLKQAPRPARASAPEKRPWFRPMFFLPAAAGLAAAAVAVLLVVGRPGRQEPEWQVRGGSAGTKAYGIRAFCVGPDGKARGEAMPGGTLVCAEGNTVQFSYTAPQSAKLSIEAAPAAGERLQFFPREGPPAQVAAGVDVALPYSTPVQGGWLPAPLEVRASFSDARGRVLSQTKVVLSPR